ncbi:MAG: efflux RND transporter periplasmic adaptor subunit, partial [Pseudomonadota bacterium]
MTRFPRAAVGAAMFLIIATGQALAQFGPQGPPAVGIVTADRRPITETSEFVGRIEAIERVAIRARVSGFIQEIAFREGQEVQRGQVLYRLERAPFEAELERQQASVASAQATLINTRISLDRARELVRTSTGTQSRLDDAIAAERTGNAQLLSAQAGLRVAQISLDYTVITAPVNGRIGRTMFTEGNVVGPDAGTLALYEKARGLAQAMGKELPHASAGGGSDGNFTGAMGIPTLDGLGVRGADAHTLNEHIEVDSLAERGRLMAGLLATL